ncbi:MAG: NAD kinase [Pseudomonadota bacterium]
MIKMYVDAAKTKKAYAYYARIAECFELVPIEQADVIVVLGGDGYMLDALHRTNNIGKPFYGVHCGTVGFLMNAIALEDIESLQQRIEKASVTKLHPLKVEAEQIDGTRTTLHAINEITLQRQTHQVCKLSIAINDKVRLKNLAGDGLIISTAAGSTAYNFSAHGPIIPLGIPLLALTPLNPFRPRHWKGAIIPNTAHIAIEVLDASNRCVEATADYVTIQNITRALIDEDTSVEFHLLFDSDHNLEERILNEQFAGGGA